MWFPEHATVCATREQYDVAKARGDRCVILLPQRPWGVSAAERELPDIRAENARLSALAGGLVEHLKPRIIAAVELQAGAIRDLGECYWTMRPWSGS